MHQYRSLAKVRYWVFTLCNAYHFKVHSSTRFNQIALKLDISIPTIVTLGPRILISKKASAGCLNTDGTSKGGYATSDGLIRTSQGDHASNFFAYYGKGSNNFAKSRVLLDGILFCTLLSIRNIQLQCNSRLVISLAIQGSPGSFVLEKMVEDDIVKNLGVPIYC